MATEKNVAKGTRPAQNKTYHGVIAAAVGILLAGLLLFVLLVVPILRARGAFRDALSRIGDGDRSCVILNDPIVEGTLINTSAEIYLTGEEADEVAEGFLSAFSSYRYLENKQFMGGLLDPFMQVVTEEGVSHVYLWEDSVWIEKNSAFYRFAPRSAEGQAAYAEWYRSVIEMLEQS